MNFPPRHYRTLPKQVSIVLVSLLLVPLPSVSSCSSSGTAPTGQTLQIHGVPVREAGESLRRAIDIKYRELAQARQIKPVGQGMNSIADVVSQFIPAGMSFEQAVATLRAAGFAIGQRQKITPLSAEAVVAKIDPYSRVMFGFGGKTSIVVVLEPSDLANWNSLGHIDAEIIESFL